MFPSANVIATDISCIQPGWVPPNLEFQIDDAQLNWTFREELFDFIHVRYLYGAIEDWPKLYRQMYAHLKPGGWFQHMEPDIKLQSNDSSSSKYVLPYNSILCTDNMQGLTAVGRMAP